MSKSTMDRVPINLYKMAEEIAKRKDIPRVQAYRELAEAVKKHTKRLKQIEPKDVFRF